VEQAVDGGSLEWLRWRWQYLREGEKKKKMASWSILYRRSWGGLEMLCRTRRERRGNGRGQRHRRQRRHDASAARCRETGANRWAGPLPQCTF
jgi:hypothetical protein